MASASDLVVVRGWKDTRETLVAWNRAPWPILKQWLLSSWIIAASLLIAVWIIAELATPDATPFYMAGLNSDATMDDVVRILQRNALVLALHGFACVAGFIAGSSLPAEAERYSGLWRKVHDKAGPLAIAFVTAATLFSLATQAYALGHAASDLADAGDVSPLVLLVGILPHAIPELVALFLPLAAWIIASRAGDWHQLLAATFATCALAVPVLVIASFVEVYVSPHVIIALRG